MSLLNASIDYTKQGHKICPNILREYDIRGIIGDSLTETDCYYVGRAFGTLLKRSGARKSGEYSIIVGFDGRETSEGFAKAVRAGIMDCGVNVTDVGLGPTPMIYFAMENDNADASVMITGSHSPVEYNGIKMSLKNGPFYSNDIQILGQTVIDSDFETGQGSLTTKDVQDAYVDRILVDRILSDYEGVKDLKIVWDAGNGATGEVLRRLTRKLSGEHILLFDEIDGTFPNHHPDPTVAENLVDLQRVVKENNCDLGIGFDGDGDRIGVVDNNGNIIWSDILMCIYAAEVLATHPKSSIIADVKCSQILFDEIKRLGGTPIIWNTGHSKIKAKMKELNSPLGGELAGHICFADHYYGFDDGLYCAVRLLNLVSQSVEGVSALVEHLPSIFNTPEVRFKVDEARKFDIAGEIKDRLLIMNDDTMDINDIDGVRVTTSDGWWLMRASNTEDVLSVRVESFSEEGLEKLKSDLIGQLKQSGIDNPF